MECWSFWIYIFFGWKLILLHFQKFSPENDWFSLRMFLVLKFHKINFLKQTFIHSLCLISIENIIYVFQMSLMNFVREKNVQHEPSFYIWKKNFSMNYILITLYISNLGDFNFDFIQLYSSLKRKKNFRITIIRRRCIITPFSAFFYFQKFFFLPSEFIRSNWRFFPFWLNDFLFVIEIWRCWFWFFSFQDFIPFGHIHWFISL